MKNKIFYFLVTSVLSMNLSAQCMPTEKNNFCLEDGTEKIDIKSTQDNSNTPKQSKQKTKEQIRAELLAEYAKEEDDTDDYCTCGLGI